MVSATVRYDALYWERQAERKLSRRFDSKNTFSRSSEPPRTPTTIPPPTNRTSTNTQRQNEGPRTTQRTPRPYDDVLGTDGRLQPEELDCRHKNKLCLVCGSGNHRANECPTAKRGRATELQVGEESGNVAKEEVAEFEKSEN